MNRREWYKENSRRRKELGIVRKKCKYCGCYIKGRHKIWCKSEAKQIKRNLKKEIIERRYKKNGF